MISIIKYLKSLFTRTKPSKIEQIIQYHFQDISLLKTSLTHKSIAPQPDKNYERLEFLGDAVLDHVVSEWLFNKYKYEDEGQLTQKRAALVKKQFLAKMATKINLVSFAKTSSSLDIKNKKVSYNLNGNIFESLIGAIFLDGGIKPAEAFIYNFLIIYENEAESNDNYKGQLIEYYQDKGISPPKFKIKKVDGPDHDKIFSIETIINENQIFIGEGKSKKEGEQNAARNALKNILN
ncbi:MAG: ribonuclease III [Candidatus Marinimicrobia bacterium]|nr:ribonuclease III [Candidatus Neomarinimicrobiota bacterium]